MLLTGIPEVVCLLGLGLVIFLHLSARSDAFCAPPYDWEVDGL